MSESLTPRASDNSGPMLPQVGSLGRAHGDNSARMVRKMSRGYAKRQATLGRLATAKVDASGELEAKSPATFRRQVRLEPDTVVTFVVLAEVGIAILYIFYELSIAAALGLHGLVTLSLVISTLLISKGRKGYPPSFFLLMVSTAFLGPVGLLGMMLTTIIRSLFADKVKGPGNSFLALFPEDTSSPHAMLCERILNGESSAQNQDTLASFSDVMAKGAIEERQAVIALISAQFKPAFASVLYHALIDHEPAVRVQAASAVAYIESTFLETAIRLKDRCDHEPESREFALDLARHFDEYANSGLLDEERAAATRLEALTLYRRCIQRGTSSEQLDALIVRILVRSGRQDEAVAVFKPLVDTGQASARLLTWYAEALFELRRYSDLRELCGKFHDAESSPALLSEPCQQAMALWAGDSSPR